MLKCFLFECLSVRVLIGFIVGVFFFGVFECWNKGVFVCWSVGMLGCWSFLVFRYWSA